MTTGSVTTGDADKRAYAARSHAWNITQKKFKELFPDVSLHFFLYPIYCGELLFDEVSFANAVLACKWRLRHFVFSVDGRIELSL